MSAKRPVAIDLFSGAGGLSEGLLSAGVRVSVAVEKHPHPALTCAFNHPETTVICGDLTSLSMTVLQKAVLDRTQEKKVDIVAGGPPCQGFSPAGRRDPNDPRNSLFEHYLRVIEHFRPRMFLFENVPGFVRLYNGKAINAIVKEFREHGYEMHGIRVGEDSAVTEFPVLDAASYGVPQHRYRFILIGWLKDELEHAFLWPQETHGSGQLPAYRCTKDAMGDLEFLSAGTECHSYLLGAGPEYQHERRANSDRLFNHLATRHRSATVRMYRHLGAGATIRTVPENVRSGKQTMARLDPAMCSKAVLALPDDLVHYRRHRIPTVREMARLQSFDDDFVFLGKRTTSDKSRRVDVPQYTQVGNAVPPLLARAVGVAMLRAMGFRPCDLRDLVVRRRRHDWIRGSSGFSGYSLLPDAEGQIELFSQSGEKMPLPLCDSGTALNGETKVADWTRLRRQDVSGRG